MQSTGRITDNAQHEVDLPSHTTVTTDRAAEFPVAADTTSTTEDDPATDTRGSKKNEAALGRALTRQLTATQIRVLDRIGFLFKNYRTEYLYDRVRERDECCS
jgi:hypothetical protein